MLWGCLVSAVKQLLTIELRFCHESIQRELRLIVLSAISIQLRELWFENNGSPGGGVGPAAAAAAVCYANARI